MDRYWKFKGPGPKELAEHDFDGNTGIDDQLLIRMNLKMFNYPLSPKQNVNNPTNIS